ncbi:Abi family protein [Nocardia sp. NPDC059177]|uniref:Abi family protein n=1 Tax=Nocardia sp. NPDC059177 TaxID=3346759 RepID=UPI0036AC106A
MDVGDESVASARLLAIGYYRLSGYWYIFREHAPECGAGCDCGVRRGEAFVPGTTLDRVIELYEFDRKLRLLVLDGIERVEVALRMRLGYALGEVGAFAHLDPAALEPAFTHVDEGQPIASRSHWLASEHAKWLLNVRGEEERSKEDFVIHFKSKYGMPLPIWVVTELMTFGSLVVLMDGLKPRQKNAVAEMFGVFDAECDGDGAALGSWIAGLKYIRNICAHHGRLWNRNMVEQFGRLDGVAELAHASGQRPKSRIYAALAVLAFLTTRLDAASGWRHRAVDLMTSTFGSLGLSDTYMGCPAGWSSADIWTPGYVPGADPVPAEHRDILRHFECSSTSEVGHLIDLRTVPERRASAVRYMRSRDQLLGLLVGRSYRFPRFQFDVDNRCIHPVVRRINQALAVGARPWDAARWWITPNDGIAGGVPMTMLESESTRACLLAATIPAPGQYSASSVRVGDLPEQLEGTS